MGWKFEGKVQRADLVTGLLTVCVALFVFAETSRMPVISAHTLGSAFWPRIIASLLLLLGIVLTVHSFTLTRSESYFSFEKGKEGNLRDILILSGITILYGGLWNGVPFLVSSPIFIFLSGRVLRLGKLATVLITVLLPVILYALFRVGLRVMIV